MSRNNAFYYVDNAYYAALEDLEDEAEAPRVDALNPFKLWDKKTLRQRRSKAANLKSLKNLCIKSVAANMDNIWCKDFVENWSGQNLAFLLGPFEQLAGRCIFDLMNELRSRNALHFRYLPTLITGNLQMLDLKNVKNINKILNSVKNRCQNNLLVLNLENCTGITETILASTLTSLKKLEQINLRGTDVSDAILDSIGSCSFPLKCLQLNDNKNISNEGLQSICTKHFAGHLLAISLDFTSVDMNGLLALLEALPHLQVLEHTSSAAAIICWKTKNHDQKRILKMRQLKLNPAEHHPDEHCLLMAVCPDLSDLSFMPSGSFTSDDLLPYLNAKKLSHFVSDSSSVPDISWFMHMGDSLTKIEINSKAATTQVDLTIIGQFCPNIKILSLHRVPLVESKVNAGATSNSFRKLQSLSLQNKTLCNSVVESLKLILVRAHQLYLFELYMFEIPDGFLQTICTESQSNEKIFSTLNTVAFVECSNLTDLGINCLVCCAPVLKSIHLHKNANSYYIDNFMSHNKLNVSIICDKLIDEL